MKHVWLVLTCLCPGKKAPMNVFGISYLIHSFMFCHFVDLNTISSSFLPNIKDWIQIPHTTQIAEPQLFQNYV
jgi:hypothetical protein